MDRDEGPWMGAIGQGRDDQDDAFCIELIGLFIGLGGFWLGGILTGGILSGGILARGDFVLGGFCPGGFCPGGVLSGGILSGGILSCHRLEYLPTNLYTSVVDFIYVCHLVESPLNRHPSGRLIPEDNPF